MKNALNFLLLILFVFGCNKDNSGPPALSEILIGEWKLKEVVEPGTYASSEWQIYPFEEVGKAYFKEDGTVIFDLDSYAEESGTYRVIKNDTIYFTILWDFAWTVIDFNETELTVSTGISIEGENKRRYKKVN